MNEIFNFQFVDRKHERQDLKEILKSEEFLITLLGENGVGKTTLLYALQDEIDHYDFIFINRKIGSSETYLSIFLNTLNDESKLTLKDYFIHNSICIQHLLSAGITSILNFKKIDYLDELISFFFNDGISFLGQNKKPMLKEDVLLNYLERINKEKNCILILDNFTNCDCDSLEVLLPLLKKIRENKIIKVILLLTENVNYDSIILELREKLFIKPYIISKLPSESEFIRILNKKMMIRKCDESIIKDLYEYCDGNPQNLKCFLMKLISKKEHDCFYSDINLEIVDIAEYLGEMRLGLNIKFNPYESAILFVCWCLGYSKTKEIIIHYSMALFNQQKYLDENFEKLVNNNILAIDNYNGFYFTYKFSHDSIFFLVENYIKKDKIISKALPSWSNCLIKEIVKAANQNELDEIESIEIQAKLSQYIMRPYVQIEKNMQFAKYLVNKHRYSQASSVLSSLCSVNQFLNKKEMLFAIDTLYHTGEYQRIIDITAGVDFKDFYFYFLKAKAFSILGEKKLSLLYIEKAYIYAKSRNNKLLLLNIELCVLLEMKDKKKLAEQKFNDYIASTRKQKNKNYTLGDGYVLKNSEDFLPNEEALEKLQLSLQILKRYKKNYMIDCVKHNMGVILFRMGKYDEANMLFEETIDSLLNYKPHECSYSLNNLAVLHMIKNEFSIACEKLEEALFWNRSPYTKTALMCNLAICKIELGYTNNAIGLLKEINEHIEYYHLFYPDILRKVAVNTAYINFKCGDITASKKQILAILKEVEGTSSELKLHRLIQNIPEMKGYLKNFPQPELDYECVPFDCWIVTLTHD
ncbi:hypothetical protein [[Eubacterium] hominis]|uniref:hypothetical protein n=1 Tax=[Eubacterium] hominis TaxID=2764325 RepID=UPI003A4DAEFA